jgi:hypothetical protein
MKEIKFDRPVTIGGTEVTMLQMREPTVEDQLTAEESGKTQARREVALFANLCEVSRDDIGRLPLKEYRQLQEAYEAFT